MAFPGDVYAADCSARDALALIAGKWTLLILPALAERPLRNGELLRRIGGISQKVLTQSAARAGAQRADRPDRDAARRSHVEYRLTPVAESLVDTLVALDRWAERHFPVLDAARERYDAAVQHMR